MRRILPNSSTIKALLLFSLLFTGTTSAQTPSKQFQIMAGFLLHFSSYVYWPKNPEKLVYCVVGSNPFGDYLANVLAARKQARHKLELVLLGHEVSTDQLQQCQVIFAQPEGYKVLGNKIQGLTGVLLVGNSPDFIQRGGMINFYREDKKIRFEIDLKGARDKELGISAQLLTVAKVHK